MSYLPRMCLHTRRSIYPTLPQDESFFIILFSRSGDVENSDFGLTNKYAFRIQHNVESPDHIPANISSRLMQLFELGQTHFDDGYDEVISLLCGDETTVTTVEMDNYLLARMTPENRWSTNIDFGSNYFVLDFKEV